MRKNLLSERDRELQELAEKYEAATANGQFIYMDADELADLADWYAVRYKDKEAMDVISYGLKLHPDNTELLIEKAYLYIDTNQLPKACRLIDQLQDDGTFTTEIDLLKARTALKLGHKTEAENIINHLDDKYELDNLVEIGYMYIETDDIAGATPWVEACEQRYGQYETCINLLADYHYTAQNYEEACKFYNKLIDINPYSPIYWYGLARSHYALEQFDQAIDACDYALVSDEDYGEAYLLRANAYFQLENDEKALEDYRLAEKYGLVSHGFIHSFIAMQQMDKEQWTSACHHLALAITEARDKADDTISLPSLYTQAAYCAYKLNKPDKAEDYLARAREVAPNDPYVDLTQGKILLEEGHTEQALKAWRKATELSPTADTWREIALTCVECGAWGIASMAMEMLKRYAPDTPDINEMLALAYLLLNDNEAFQKYNRLCAKPLTEEFITQIQDYASNAESREILIERINEIINILK